MIGHVVDRQKIVKKYTDPHPKMVKKKYGSSMFSMDRVMPGALCISNQLSLVLVVCP